MPEKTNDKEAKGAAKPSPLKDEILQRINEQEARERESGTRSGLRPVAPAACTTSRLRSRQRFREALNVTKRRAVL